MPMYKKTKITEGLRAGDLKTLVQKTISVDEYESKISDAAVVFGFYVHDRDAAADLNRFIQKSPIKLLDTEISPSPDQHGYYLVFVEILKNKKLGEVVKELLLDIEPLVGFSDWKMRVRQPKSDVKSKDRSVRSNNVHDFNAETLMQLLGRNDAAAKKNKVMSFVKDSDLEDAVVKDDDVVQVKTTHRPVLELKIISFGEHDRSLYEAVFDFKSIATANLIERYFGVGWLCEAVSNSAFRITRENSSDALIVTLFY